jgi:hypothetical protein
MFQRRSRCTHKQEWKVDQKKVWKCNQDYVMIIHHELSTTVSQNMCPIRVSTCVLFEIMKNPIKYLGILDWPLVLFVSYLLFNQLNKKSQNSLHFHPKIYWGSKYIWVISLIYCSILGFSSKLTFVIPDSEKSLNGH